MATHTVKHIGRSHLPLPELKPGKEPTRFACPYFSDKKTKSFLTRKLKEEIGKYK